MSKKYTKQEYIDTYVSMYSHRGVPKEVLIKEAEGWYVKEEIMPRVWGWGARLSSRSCLG